MSMFIRAVSTKEHKANFIASAESTIAAINELTRQYEENWEKLEGYRKERAALIEDIIKAIKEGNIKIRKQLCRCDNTELNEVLEEVVDDLDLTQQELIKCALVKINIRYKQIDELGKKLEELAQELHQYRTSEPDYNQEVVIDFAQAKASAKDRMKEKAMQPKVEVESSLTEVVNTKPAGKEVVVSLESYINRKQKPIPINNDELSSAPIIEEEDLKNNNDGSDLEAAIGDDLDSEILDYLVTGGIEEVAADDYEEVINEIEESETLAEVEEDEECVAFTIENDITLKDIAERVYASADYWEPLYNYGSNKARIDRVAAEHKLPYHVVCTKSGYLNGVELQFPLELVTYEAVHSEEEGPVKGLAA